MGELVQKLRHLSSLTQLDLQHCRNFKCPGQPPSIVTGVSKPEHGWVWNKTPQTPKNNNVKKRKIAQHLYLRR